MMRVRVFKQHCCERTRNSRPARLRVRVQPRRAANCQHCFNGLIRGLQGMQKVNYVKGKQDGRQDSYPHAKIPALNSQNLKTLPLL
ncbi:MAG: hypothetical protein IJR21_07905 [Synergistaceae bacterium]|nr:hypothetical protein [Synergistaceae bacterium]